MVDQEIEEVLARLRQGVLGRDTIALLAARLIELRNPGLRTEFESEIKMVWPDGKSNSMFLHNLWSWCERSQEERAGIVDRYVRVLASQGQDRPETSAENIEIGRAS